MTALTEPAPNTRRSGLATVIGLTTAVWVVEMTAYTGLGLMSGRTLSLANHSTLIVAGLMGLGFSALLYSLAVRTRTLGTTRYALVALAAVLATVAFVFADAIANMVFQDLSGQPPIPPEVLARGMVRTGIEVAWIFGTLSAVYLVLQANRMVAERERQLTLIRTAASEANAAASAAQLSALRYQLNPHFLFNTLNALSSLVVTGRNVDAEVMIGKLSDFLRASLGGDPDAEVPLDDELATMQAYLEIEGVRFGERLSVEVVSPTDLLDALVPSFILQPLVENAVKYAVAPSRRPVSIHVEARQEGDDLVLIVQDDGGQAFGALPKGGTGVGLVNVRKRLVAMYGPRGELRTTARERGFTALIRLPLKRALPSAAVAA